MKTAVSLPDPLFQEAERLADERGLSRSELYSRAIAQYIKSERFAGVRERLDAVYGAAAEDSSLDPLLERMQGAALAPEDW